MASEGTNVLAPRELIIPKREGADQPAVTTSGALFMSGQLLLFANGNNVIMFSGATIK